MGVIIKIVFDYLNHDNHCSWITQRFLSIAKSWRIPELIHLPQTWAENR